MHGAAYADAFGPTSALSDRLADALKRKGGDGAASPFAEPFKFLGSITLQAFLLQCGLLNGHSPTCPKSPRCAAGARKRARQCGEPVAAGGGAGEPRTATRRRAARHTAAGASSSPSADDVWL